MAVILEKDVEGNSCGIIQVLSQHVTGEVKDNGEGDTEKTVFSGRFKAHIS
jgi:hypothetical protein